MSMFGRLSNTMNTTGRGIAFVIPVEKVVGVAHFIERMRDEG